MRPRIAATTVAIVTQWVKAGAVIETLVVVPDHLTAANRNIAEAAAEVAKDVLEVTADVYDVLSFREDSQPLAATVLRRHDTLPERPRPRGR